MVWISSYIPYKTLEVITPDYPGGGGGGGGGVQHCPSTGNATRVKKGVETIHFAQFWWKIGSKYDIFLIFAKM